jgi:hypothetical protein
VSASTLPSSDGELGDALNAFIERLDALQSVFGPMREIVSAIVIACGQNWNDFLDKNGELVAGAGAEAQYKFEISHGWELKRLRSQLSKAEAGALIVPQNFVVALVSQFDSFVGDTLRALYRAKKDLLNSSERTLTFSALNDFANLDDVRAHILEKEIENVLRDSHAGQFEWMEKKFDVALREGLAVWPTFIELTERRNLFTHCNGIVSPQYLAVCDKHKVVHGTSRPSRLSWWVVIVGRP